MNTFNQHWKEIESNFDWNKVYQTMKLLDWDWHGVGIPTISILISTAKNMCKQAYEEKTIVSSGGFIAKYDEGIELKFILEEWDDYD